MFLWNSCHSESLKIIKYFSFVNHLLVNELCWVMPVMRDNIYRQIIYAMIFLTWFKLVLLYSTEGYYNGKKSCGQFEVKHVLSNICFWITLYFWNEQLRFNSANFIIPKYNRFPVICNVFEFIFLSLAVFWLKNYNN